MRVWAYGCSFTEYSWPTWADIIINQSHELGGKGYNLGKCGAGNMLIASRIWECNAKYQFNKDDWVFICWSGINREDRYLNGSWCSPGNLNNKNPYGGVNFLKHWTDEKFSAMRDCMLITSTINGLKNLGVNVVHFTMNPYIQLMDMYSFHTPKESQALEVLGTYNLSFDIPTSYMEIIDTVDQRPEAAEKRIPASWDGKHVIPEWHPFPDEHQMFVETHLSKLVPWLSSGLTENTVNFCKEWDEKIKNLPRPILLGGENTGWNVEHDLDIW